jgi:hypothetical protein
MAEKQLSDGGPDGTVLGQSATDLIGFHGTDGTVQVALSATPAAATTAAISGASSFGFTCPQADAIRALVNALRAALVSKGIAST